MTTLNTQYENMAGFSDKAMAYFSEHIPDLAQMNDLLADPEIRQLAEAYAVDPKDLTFFQQIERLYAGVEMYRKGVIKAIKERPTDIDLLFNYIETASALISYVSSYLSQAIEKEKANNPVV